MGRCRECGILFGASITVITHNRAEVISRQYLSELRAKGCGVVIFVEYVPTDGVSDHLALSADEAAGMVADVEHARELFDDMIILAFPGDEAAMGGCLASGRGFFHINPQGGAEPCPFSPFSEHSVRTDSLREILDSQFFDGTRHIALNAGSHVGGCVLFERDEEVRALLA